MPFQNSADLANLLSTVVRNLMKLGREKDTSARRSRAGQRARIRDRDDCSVKIKSLEAPKIMKIEWLDLGCIEADFFKVTKYSLENS